MYVMPAQVIIELIQKQAILYLRMIIKEPVSFLVSLLMNTNDTICGTRQHKAIKPVLLSIEVIKMYTWFRLSKYHPS